MEGAFSATRLTGVTLLAAQAAAALEYADVFGRLEDVVAQRTRELSVAHDRLLELDKRAAEVQMAGGFAHEVRNALSTAAYALESCFQTGAGLRRRAVAFAPAYRGNDLLRAGTADLTGLGGAYGYAL